MSDDDLRGPEAIEKAMSRLGDLAGWEIAHWRQFVEAFYALRDALDMAETLDDNADDPRSAYVYLRSAAKNTLERLGASYDARRDFVAGSMVDADRIRSVLSRATGEPRVLRLVGASERVAPPVIEVRVADDALIANPFGRRLLRAVYDYVFLHAQYCCRDRIVIEVDTGDGLAIAVVGFTAGEYVPVPDDDDADFVSSRLYVTNTCGADVALVGGELLDCNPGDVEQAVTFVVPNPAATAAIP